MKNPKTIIKVLSATTLLVSQSCYAQSSDWKAHMDAGKEACVQRHFPEAENLFSRAIEEAEQFGPADPRLGESLYWLANVYFGNNNHEKAQALCKRSIAVTEKALGPNNPAVLESLCLLSNSYVLDGNFELAKPLTKRALKISSTLDYSDAIDSVKRRHEIAKHLNNLGVCYINEKQPAKAEQIYDEAIRLNPRYATAYLNRSIVRRMLLNLKGAEEDEHEAKRFRFPNQAMLNKSL